MALENDRVKVWSISLAPHTPESIGSADHDSVELFFDGGEIRSTPHQGAGETATRRAGQAVYLPAGTRQTEEVLSNDPVRVFVIELKGPNLPPTVNHTNYPLAFPRPGSEKMLENDRVVVWNYTYKMGTPTPMHYHNKDALIVFRLDGAIQSVTPDGAIAVTDHKAGSIQFSKGDRTHYEELASGEQSIIVTELQ